MCFSAIVSAVGVGVSAMGAAQNAKAQKQQAQFNAMQSMVNAQIAEQDKADIAAQGAVAIEEQKRAITRSLSTVRAATAGAGLAVDQEGTTPQDIYKSMVVYGELDIMRMRTNIRREQRLAQMRANQQISQAMQSTAQANSIKPGMAFANSLIGGLARNADVLFPGG